MQLIQTYGWALLFPAAFVVTGIAGWLNVLWGLITGGPRALQAPGAPYLFDRVYYLLYGIGLFGWSFGLLSFPTISGSAPHPEAGFLIGWGIAAMGMGLWLILRGDMVIDAARYRAEHGFWLFRGFHSANVNRLERWNPTFRKLFAGMFMVIGAGVLAFNLPHLAEAVSQAGAGLAALIHLVTTGDATGLSFMS